MTPTQVWSNESQERYVLGIDPSHLGLVKKLCDRENCLVAHVGTVTLTQDLILLEDGNEIVNVDLNDLFAPMPKSIDLQPLPTISSKSPNCSLSLLNTLLKHPSIGNKSYLVTINDRSIGGHVLKEPMQGIYQVPLSDCGVVSLSYTSNDYKSMSLGQSTSAVHALNESLLNLACCLNPTQFVASANWMVNSHSPTELTTLYNNVNDLATVCKQLNISIPVGKDSMSMTTQFNNKSIQSPMTCCLTLTATVEDYKQQCFDKPELHLYSITCRTIKNSLNGTLGGFMNGSHFIPTSTFDPLFIKELFSLISHHWSSINAIHDISDGGIGITLIEMSFGNKIGFTVSIDSSTLYLEGNGIVIATTTSLDTEVLSKSLDYASIHYLGKTNSSRLIEINTSNDSYSTTINEAYILWSTVHTHMKTLRDGKCAVDELECYLQDYGTLKFNPLEIQLTKSKKGKMAIMRDQGTNGHMEMAYAFQSCGWEVVDVHMNDLITKTVSLSMFNGLVFCGGFSYGDTLGAGRGWALKLFKHCQSDMIQFINNNKFILGVCNGCQMLGWLFYYLKKNGMQIEDYPLFSFNDSSQFEGRTCMVKLTNNPSAFSHSIEFPIHVAHGEGKLIAPPNCDLHSLLNDLNTKNRIVMRYIDKNGPTMHYPLNPNGSIDGITGVCSSNGKIVLMMPHPERGILNRQFTFQDNHDGYTVWMDCFNKIE